MSSYAQWLQDNDRQLAVALDALRARLRQLAEGEGASAGVASHELPVLPTSPEHRFALDLLANRLGLSAFERNIVLLCAAMELDTGTGALCARALGDAAKSYPTFALAMRMFDAPAWDALSPERPLRYWRLVEIHQPGAQPLIGAALRADERIVNFIKGLNYLDDRLALVLAPLRGEATPLPPSQRDIANAIVLRVQATPPDAAPPLLQLLGSDTASKEAVARAVANALELQPYRLDAERMPASLPEQEGLVRLWQRECMLLPLALYFDASDTGRDDVHALAAQRFLARIGGLVFVDAREQMATGAADALSIDVAKPTVEEQRAAWQAALGDAANGHPQRLAGHFDFGIAQVRQVAGDALKIAGMSSQPLADLLWQGALARARPALDRLAQRIEPVAGWDDLQLPAQEKALLRQVADQVALRTTVYDDWGFRARMNRGLGISALFAGESGTGKTMAAEVLARELGMLLYRIDLSAVVSKYIGETEKNLRRLFDAAETGGVILFFDEADALFGRRSEVKDSHDRYANIEVNYLLQRMESYGGLAILATNMKSALDAAFLRRLRFVINFPFPGVAERRAIWASVFPAKTATAALDLHRLARLPLTGGSIHGIALNAAFVAAKTKVQIGMPMLLDAARAEYRKLDKPVNEADFRWLESAGGKP